MSTRSLTLLVFAAAAVLLPTTPASASRAANRLCAKGTAKVMAASDQVRVVQAPHSYIACVGRRATNALTLRPAPSDADFAITKFKVVGRWIAWAELSDSQSRYSLRTCEAGAPKRSTFLDIDFDAEQLDENSTNPLRTFAINEQGSLTWLEQFVDTRRINVADSAGRRVTAEGSDIDPSSLAMSTSGAFWTTSGTPSFAPLNGFSAPHAPKSCGIPGSAL